ncbi:MAG: S-layer homology domain-containing protein [Acidimicrobiaceae bacterium]|nr:S-layer homology domain-containing protein [Acidimicrobiaceae bacterium]
MRRRGRAAALLAALAVLATAAAASGAAAQDQPGTYADVAEGVHRPAIEALAAKGLFEGTLCGDDEFCPTEPIERSTMAVWLLRALEETEWPEPRAPRFADVAAEHPWAGHIERLAQLNITVGCRTQPLRFCPQGSVTRAQMASFLARAFDLEAAEPAGFADLDPDSSHNANIDALAASGITAGCADDPLRYCPQRPVTRAEMATFLARALDRSQDAPPTAPVDPQATPPPPPPASPPPQEPVDAPPDNGNLPDSDPNARSPESDPSPRQPPQEPVDAPPDDAPPDDTPPDDERRSCVDGLCFIPLTEEEWREAYDEIFGE